jgi:putative ABC transport system substrate-binding protein
MIQFSIFDPVARLRTGFGFSTWKIKSASISIFSLCAVLLAIGISAQAQQPRKVPRIGLLSSFSASVAEPWHEAFRQGLRDLGWTEEKSIRIEPRYSEGKSERLPELAAELVRLKVDVIVTSITPETLAAKNATKKIPIVMASVNDPIGSGFVDSLAHPGGNITGLTNVASDLSGKRLELLKEIVPGLKGVGILWDPGGPASSLTWKESQAPARALGLQLYSMEPRNVNDFAKAFADATHARVGALVIAANSLVTRNQKLVAELAVKHRLPSISLLSEFVESGGLMAYGPDRSDLFRRAATYVDKILKGRKPADLPVQQPTKFELLINLKTAKQIGLTIPQRMLTRADKVIR